MFCLLSSDWLSHVQKSVHTSRAECVKHVGSLRSPAFGYRPAHFTELAVLTVQLKP